MSAKTESQLTERDFESGFRDDERWWEQTLEARRLRHLSEPGESEECSWPECVWHGLLPGDANLPLESSPP